MNRSEAHSRLDALRDKREWMTNAEIREALLATGDMERAPPPKPTNYGFAALQTWAMQHEEAL